MKKLARVKLDNTIKRYGREWKELLDCFDNYSKSSSKEVLRIHEINFILKMNEILSKESKTNRNEDKQMKNIRSTGRTRVPENYMEYVRLVKEN